MSDDNPYLDVWDTLDEEPDPVSETYKDPTRMRNYGGATAHGKSSLNERTSMHWPGNQRTEFDLPTGPLGFGRADEGE